MYKCVLENTSYSVDIAVMKCKYECTQMCWSPYTVDIVDSLQHCQQLVIVKYDMPPG